MTIQRKAIPNDKQLPVYLYELNNNKGTTIKITNIGCTITSITTPDRDGKIEEIALGFDDPMTYLSEDYLKNCSHFGATAGRYAGRIAKGQFNLLGKTYQLAVNDGENHLHGGPKGFHQKIWEGTIKDNQLIMKLESPHNDEGYPGSLKVEITITLTAEHELIIDYFAKTTHATPVNLTNHTYFNLSGLPGNILNHEVMIMADHYTPDINGIPTGEITSVKNTPFDFSTFTAIGERINQLPENNYNHNFVLNQGKDELARASIVKENISGRILEVFTTLPAIHFYTASYLDGTYSRGSRKFNSFEGFCMETQQFPDAPNKPQFADAIVTPDKPFKHTTIFKFSTDK